MMHALLSNFTKNRWALPFLAVFALAVIFSAAVLPQSAHAAGGVGAGGTGSSGGGSSGTPHTNNGYGWYVFDVDGAVKPQENMRNGSKWSAANATCKAANATKIVAFIIQIQPGNNPTSAVVYSFTTQNAYSVYNPSIYSSPWETNEAAQTQYNAIKNPPYNVNTTGYTFGGPNGNVAWFCYQYKPQNWNITPSVKINKTTVAPGDTVTWTHTIKNDGEATSSKIKFGNNLSNSYTTSGALAPNATDSWKSTYKVDQDDVGQTKCRATIAAPRSNTDSGSINSSSACFTVPYDYTLTPTLSINYPDVVSNVDTPITVSPVVKNSGPTKSKAAQWQVTQFIVSPTKAIPHLSDTDRTSTQAPCTYFSANVTSCGVINNDTTKGKGNQIFNATAAGGALNTALNKIIYNTTDLPVGTKICFALSIQPYSDSSTKWNHSKPICVVISKSPSVQILGGDLRVGAGFDGSTTASKVDTSVTIKAGKSYGSWDEYAIMAKGSVSGMASASGFAGGIDCTDVCTTKDLTFANSPTLGGFTPTTKIPDVAAAFPVTSTTPAFSSLTDAANRRVETGSGNITIAGGTIKKGQWLVINAPTATVTITGNINYEDVALSSGADIPQLVIIANQINIIDTVTNVDAWLIASGATGNINTCSAKTLNGSVSAIGVNDDLSSTLCASALTINGPVMAKRLYLRRTAGADKGTGSANPAEIINLRPDAYIWGAYQAAQNAVLPTNSSNELPPRY